MQQRRVFDALGLRDGAIGDLVLPTFNIAVDEVRERLRVTRMFPRLHERVSGILSTSTHCSCCPGSSSVSTRSSRTGSGTPRRRRLPVRSGQDRGGARRPGAWSAAIDTYPGSNFVDRTRGTHSVVVAIRATTHFV